MTWYKFVCHCGYQRIVNGNGVCFTCKRRMVVSFTRTLQAETGDRRFVPNPEGKEVIRELHTGVVITGAWFPLQPGTHRNADRRKRPEPEYNGAVVRRR